MQDFEQIGFDVRETGGGERILPGSIEQKVVTGDDGELEPLISARGRSR